MKFPSSTLLLLLFLFISLLVSPAPAPASSPQPPKPSSSPPNKISELSHQQMLALIKSRIPKNGLYSNSILGHNNIIEGNSNYNAIFGVGNYMLGHNNGIFGNRNKVEGEGNIVGEPDE